VIRGHPLAEQNRTGVSAHMRRCPPTNGPQMSDLVAIAYDTQTSLDDDTEDTLAKALEAAGQS
jgi:hypothetical protein